MSKVKNVHISNESGVFRARVGFWKMQKSVFTHRNPKNGKVWGEDLCVDGKNAGMWVPYEEVIWL